ncbi:MULTISPECIES: 16S rRNA (cytidine(1402)-2'-O)-methyltransferase [Thermomonas]|jgi:16S rRNA (cytidine1402-2'-O)-methyltransferase|uniref:Ribosomal RNA small subunit methyltransferase I n=1 Tax=Thermomonas beijingensis TaxID=2872701 RepID=A0ABS7TAP8_9GAMM|nr:MULTISPECIES: 16S rRNA (cytidine(1402)-2'-O)-methyltransferase [Thermomonas]MBS0458534.1 16S rRNA (cytidine(1402)-2'-O)-methyltransferase [Pseudomonadota bacterium]MDE2382192.1 16S rRNA (cytidine(1402)-2'-O)-methyltransferase [Xanthomonadaceae bacterium]MBZ4184910.1 16S rRNA (cytidine(1402)-2'-O)-methyltransferase [Thermomonas beijingensis]HOC11171.1 16S rRNA (cytidine(1402)-2'-O)-methyltransferase [Thermomonas sp.]HQA02073.1 16S rRNA (cytidine(1402)-2'-O)-methyltransferase [Thermomonas sp.
MHVSGTLFVVATPIGNLGDISPRALETLKTVAAICAEDTRHTRQLLAHFGMERPLIALHDHNEDGQSAQLVARLQAGDSLALVSDAGTPLVSDPGFRLVRAAREAGIKVSPVPGASALIAALSVAGLPSDRFVFEGFLPAKPKARREHLASLASETRTLIFYESSHRIEDTLIDAVAAFGGERRVVLARELTKLFETVLDGSMLAVQAQVAADPNQRKGEFVLLVQGTSEDADASITEGRRLYAKLSEHLPPSTAAKLAAELSGAPRKALYGAE